MEIYRNSTQYLYLDIHGDVADEDPVATITMGDDDPVVLAPSNDTAAPPNDDPQRWAAVVGFSQTSKAGQGKLVWNFTINGVPATKTEWIDIVVPLADIADIREELELGSEVSDAQIIRAERKARRIIENFTGQQFAPVEQTVWINSSSDKYLNLPKRIISIDEISTSKFPITTDSVQISENGWYLLKTGPFYTGNIYSPKYVIDDPYHDAVNYWRGGEVVALRGVFGWERVPAAIFEAALILIEERLCPETLYRDRYVKTMTAADFRFEFNPMAYSGTGNVVADHILTNWRINNMAVV